jgi:hypothetical protein
MKLVRMLSFLSLLTLMAWSSPIQVSGLQAAQQPPVHSPAVVGRLAGWKIQTVESDGSVGGYAQLALDSVGRPHIAYHDYQNTAVKYVWWTGNAWNIEIVDAEHWVGEGLSLALDTADEPHITYYDRSTGELKYAHRSGSLVHISRS